jgi:predicted MFS family arabinose efflux permease
VSSPTVPARVAVLALGTFAIGTDGFVIAGVLPGIAHDTATSLADAGLLVTAFAIVYALAAPLLTAAVARVDRRAVLVAGMAVLAVANGVAAVAHGYTALMAARVIAALGAAAYSPVAMATGVQLSEPRARARAIAVVLGGLTVSLVVGVPLGTLLGALGSWRWTFAFVAVVAALSAGGVALLLPAVPAAPVSSLRTRLALLRRVPVVGNLAATFLAITGAFVLYTFITPLLTEATGWQGASISMLLLVYGGAAFAGNVLGGRAADHWGARRTVVLALCSLVVSMTAAGWAAALGSSAGRVVIVVALVAWPLAGWALTPAQSHRLITLAPAAGPEVLSLNTSAVYLGIAAGAAVGAAVLHRVDAAWLGPCAALLQLLALAVVIFLRAGVAASVSSVTSMTAPVAADAT